MQPAGEIIGFKKVNPLHSAPVLLVFYSKWSFLCRLPAIFKPLGTEEKDLHGQKAAKRMLRENHTEKGKTVKTVDMTIPKAINIQDFDYELPDERIAKYPLKERDTSRLLVWQDGVIRHQAFYELPELLRGDEIFFFNNTRVIPARLFFRKETGSLIETFLLSPEEPALVEQAMRAAGTTTWACAVGNLKRWKDGQTLLREIEADGKKIILKATLVSRRDQIVQFEWDSSALPFARIVEACGEVPIPPYLNREAEFSDRSTYQTVYSKKDGAVAAPTAGLHFTPRVLDSLKEKGVQLEELTLHVSAGTFKPVSAGNALEHEMHAEQVSLTRQNVAALATGRKIIAVGTTSLRTLESLYWFGVRLMEDPEADFDIGQYEPYGHDSDSLPGLATVAEKILDYMTRNNLPELHGNTRIYIVPGYRFRVADMLITNFHQPASTLLLLVSAFTGGENWKEIYRSALENDYRFLSYGDSSMLISNK